MKRPLIVIILLIATMVIAFVLPKPKYRGLDILKQVNIPAAMTGWQSRDVSESLRSNMKEQEVYNFVDDVFARVYRNFLGEQFLAAGNFHNPKICYGSSGYRITELEDVELTAGATKFKAHALYLEKGNEGLIMVYWICINKKIVGWTEQKALELWASLLQKKKAGLMIRLDIPTRKGGAETSFRLAQDFIKDLSRHLSPEQSEYFFGK
jgi:EpsI family protein